jgi:hypothetical protein
MVLILKSNLILKSKKNKAVICSITAYTQENQTGLTPMQLFRDLALGKIKAPKNTVIVCIPVYNIVVH